MAELFKGFKSDLV